MSKHVSSVMIHSSVKQLVYIYDGILL